MRNEVIVLAISGDTALDTAKMAYDVLKDITTGKIMVVHNDRVFDVDLSLIEIGRLDTFKLKENKK